MGRHHANDPIIFVATARGRTKGLGEPSHRHPCSPIDSTANRQSTRGVDTDALPKARVVATFFTDRQPPIAHRHP